MNQLPLYGVVNGVSIHTGNNYWYPQREILITPRLEEIYIPDRVLERDNEFKMRYPGVLPDIKLAMGILQATYMKVFDLYTRIGLNLLYEEFLKGFKNGLPIDTLSSFVNENVVDLIHGDFDLTQIGTEILDAFAGEGYKYSYFGWVKVDNRYIKARDGEIPLFPNTFPIASQLTDNLYGKYLKAIRDRINWLPREDRMYISNNIGWRKKDLLEAIKNSGLMKKTDIKYKGRQTDKVILLKDVVPQRIGTVEKVLGLGKYPYLSKEYYETLYRKIFQTSDYVDWTYLCKNRLVSYNDLKTAAVKDYEMNYNVVKRLKYGEICNAISEISRERGEASAAMAKELVDQSFLAAPEVILQPYSRWVKPVTRYQFREGAKVEHPYDRYIMLRDACQAASTKEEVIDLAARIGIRTILPRDLTPYTKEDICDYLIETYKPQAKKYERIYFDCRNPNISKRHIINTANIMGLGEIFPKDITGLSKADVCDIVNNYVNILLEAKK